MDVMEYIKSLEAVLVDYSAAQAQGFKNCIKIIFGQEEGLKQAERLLKGCSVHWLRSCQRVANLCVDPLIQPNFMRLCIAIRNMENLNEVLETFSKIEEIYSDLKPWIDWWTRDDNLKLLCRSFSSNNHWVSTPNDTNIVESLNNVLDRVSSQNASVQFISEFHLDRSFVEDIHAASNCLRLSYRDRCKDAREKQNKTRKTKRYRQRSLDELLDSRAPDNRRMGIGNGRENISAFDKFVLDVNAKLNNSGTPTLEDVTSPKRMQKKRSSETAASNANTIDDPDSISNRPKRKRRSTALSSSYIYH